MNDDKLCRACDMPIEDTMPPCPLQCGSDKCKSYKKDTQIDYSKSPIIWVIGAPGAGKRAQCEKIASKFGYVHLSVGDLLREEAGRGTDKSKCLKSVLEHGNLAPADLVLSLLKHSMEFRKHAKGFVIEGYPRDLRQGLAFEKTIAPANAIIFLEASHETLLRNLKGRGFIPGRSDDSDNAINARLKAFYDYYKNILARYPNIVTKVNAELSSEEIFKEIIAAIEEVQKKIQN